MGGAPRLGGGAPRPGPPPRPLLGRPPCWGPVDEPLEARWCESGRAERAGAGVGKGPALSPSPSLARSRPLFAAGRRADGADVAPPAPPCFAGASAPPHALPHSRQGGAGSLPSPLPDDSAPRRSGRPVRPCRRLGLPPSAPRPSQPQHDTHTHLSRPPLFLTPTAQEWKRSRHPQLFYESKLYKIMAGAGERDGGETERRRESGAELGAPSVSPPPLHPIHSPSLLTRTPLPLS